MDCCTNSALAFRAGRVAGLAEIRARMAELEEALPGTMMCCLQDQLRRIDALADGESTNSSSGSALGRSRTLACRAIAAVPGIGRLTATALVATMGDAGTFKSGREFAAFLGLGASPERHRWQGSPGAHIEARGSLPAHVAHPRRAIRAVAHQGADGVAEGRFKRDDLPMSRQWPSPARWRERRGQSSHTDRFTSETM